MRLLTLPAWDYYVGGNTALLDALGNTIHRIINSQRSLPADRRAGRMVFVIITDGMENASRRYSLEEVRRLIERERDQYGWEFIFLGANIDAINTAATMGIRADRAQNYLSDARGTEASWASVRKATSHARMAPAMACAVPSNWDAEVAADYRARAPRK